MAFSVLKRIVTALAVGVLALLVVGCSQTVSDTKAPAKPDFTAQSRPLPAIVNGVPLLDLAKHALGAAEAYGVSKPFNVQAVVTTEAALHAQFSVAGGATEPEYVVTLHGRFSCGYCGTDIPPSTTTTDSSAVRVSTMVLELPIPLPSGATTGIAVGVGTPDLAKLGHVYDLDPYIKSLAGVSVPRGPLPG
jgi:hypothetical protein